jgi:hypothetical protein
MTSTVQYIAAGGRPGFGGLGRPGQGGRGQGQGQGGRAQGRGKPRRFGS